MTSIFSLYCDSLVYLTQFLDIYSLINLHICSKHFSNLEEIIEKRPEKQKLVAKFIDKKMYHHGDVIKVYEDGKEVGHIEYDTDEFQPGWWCYIKNTWPLIVTKDTQFRDIIKRYNIINFNRTWNDSGTYVRYYCHYSQASTYFTREDAIFTIKQLWKYFFFKIENLNISSL